MPEQHGLPPSPTVVPPLMTTGSATVPGELMRNEAPVTVDGCPASGERRTVSTFPAVFRIVPGSKNSRAPAFVPVRTAPSPTNTMLEVLTAGLPLLTVANDV